MGHLKDGTWHTGPLARTKGGRFERPPSVWRNWITPDGAPAGAASPPRAGGITSMSRSPARGRTAR
jgi:glutathionyl-hydroquinone reductase